MEPTYLLDTARVSLAPAITWELACLPLRLQLSTLESAVMQILFPLPQQSGRWLRFELGLLAVAARSRLVTRRRNHNCRTFAAIQLPVLISDKNRCRNRNRGIRAD